MRTQPSELTVPAALLITGSADVFGQHASTYRRELLVHCYRMLGSIDDAEDAVQDAFVRAWHRRDTFQKAISFRAWLYRIATNACIDAIRLRKRSGIGAWSFEVGPAPDDALEETSAGPEERYDAHESISLAFLTVLQLLPPRQRAVLILRDVLSWRAAEVAQLLEMSVPAVNSALHRARTTVSREYVPISAAIHHPEIAALSRLRSLLDRYVQAWEATDVAGLVALLRDDAVVSMPPGVTLTGPQEIGAFLARSVFIDGTRMRLMPVHANGSAGFVVFSGSRADTRLRPYALLILEADDSRIARISVFVDRRLIARFGLPEELTG